MQFRPINRWASDRLTSLWRPALSQLRTPGSATLILIFGISSCLIAEDQPNASLVPESPLKQRLDDLEKQVQTLQKQVQDATQQGAAAASLEQRVWKLEADSLTDDGFYIAGVGDATLTVQRGQGKSATADFNPIFLYSFKDSLLFVAELNADQDGVALGQAFVAFTSLPHLVIAAGLFPVPFGAYSERLSPSWINKFSGLAPAPYNEDFGVFSGDQTGDGIQVRGDIPFDNNVKMNYHVFVIAAPTYNAPDAVEPDHRLAFGGTSSGHIPPTFGGRIGLLPLPTAEVGLSFMTGRIVNNQTVDPTIDNEERRSFAAVALDGEYHLQGVVLRGECARVNYQDPSGSRQHTQGAYLQASHRFSTLPGWESGFELALRIGRVQRSADDNGFQNVSEIGVGVSYYFTNYIRTSLIATDHSVHDLDEIVLNTSYAF